MLYWIAAEELKLIYQVMDVGLDLTYCSKNGGNFKQGPTL